MTKEIPAITELHTACLDCTFAIKDKQKQIGCKFNRLDLYKKDGAEIIKAYDAHNNEFDVINMRICMYKRGEEWAKEIPKHEQEETVDRELRIKYQAMVYFTDHLLGRQDALKGLDKTLRSLDKQKIPPRVVTVISKRKDISQKDLVNHVLHLKHAGNCFNIPILEKIKEFEEGSLKFIMEIRDICPSIKE